MNDYDYGTKASIRHEVDESEYK